MKSLAEKMIDKMLESGLRDQLADAAKDLQGKLISYSETDKVKAKFDFNGSFAKASQFGEWLKFEFGLYKPQVKVDQTIVALVMDE